MCLLHGCLDITQSEMYVWQLAGSGRVRFYAIWVSAVWNFPRGVRRSGGPDGARRWPRPGARPATRFREGGTAPHGGCRHAPAPGAGDSAEAGDVPPGRRQAAHQPWTARRRPTVTGLRRSPRPQCPITFPVETWHPAMKIAPSAGGSQRVAASSAALRHRRGRGGARQRLASKPLAEPGGST